MAAADTIAVAAHLAKIGHTLCSGDSVVVSVAFARTHMVYVTSYGYIIEVAGNDVNVARSGDPAALISDDVGACIKGVALSESITSPGPFIQSVSCMIDAAELVRALYPLTNQRTQYQSERAALVKALAAVERIYGMEDTIASLKEAIDERTALIKGIDDEIITLHVRLNGRS